MYTTVRELRVHVVHHCEGARIVRGRTKNKLALGFLLNLDLLNLVDLATAVVVRSTIFYLKSTRHS